MIQGLLLEEGIPSLVRRSGGFDVPDFLAAGPRDIVVAASGRGGRARDPRRPPRRAAACRRSATRTWVRALAVTLVGRSSLAGVRGSVLLALHLAGPR